MPRKPLPSRNRGICKLGAPIEVPSMGSIGVEPTPATSTNDRSTPSQTIVVPLVFSGGTFEVPATINGQISLNFIVDSGASDVSIPADVVLTLARTGTITSDDFIGSGTYVLADGSNVPSERFTIRSLRIGSVTLENVTAGIAPVSGSLLLGQSFLSRFSSWSMDNNIHALVLNSGSIRSGSGPGPTDVVRTFDLALSTGDGLSASALVIPEKRTGSFSAMAMTDYYSTLIEKLRLVSVEPIDENSALAQYSFVSKAGACHGKAVVTTLTRPDGIFISSIRALNGCFKGIA